MTASTGTARRDHSSETPIKTQALLDAGYLVVRIREEKLPHLELEHPNLLQFNQPWSYDDTHADDMAQIVEKWAKGRFALAA
ncbi:hypothetical protein [Auritidibacter ignavus]|uniref:Uncharacterized protein n=1 Tax=Auritidibacter ignavus TaxID=678932 RepID=A0AAJ6AHZ2_9MICC|nr:hypothetical protein [Auritidibacter ignavus]NIH72598.1 hypothetical protein [Auritidibacter ignavus]WGH83094.1 hypothetical protein QDX20_07345 [Auritidibacter ignavus]WGH92372.1 hypothetical protein QDX21_08565 [Auritidibacter ignavus]